MAKKVKIAFVGATTLAVFLLWFIPSFNRARSIAASNSCINHLQTIHGAKQQWTLEHHKTTNDVPTWDDLIGTGRYLQEMPVCPQGGTYTLGRLDQRPRCSIPEHTLEALSVIKTERGR